MGEQARQFDRQADLAELNAAVVRATQQGEATGVYVDPDTGQQAVANGDLAAGTVLRRTVLDSAGVNYTDSLTIYP